MSIRSRVFEIYDRLRWAARGFVLGPAVVDAVDKAWGRSPAEYQPEEYGQYLRTSGAIYACAKLRANMLSGLSLQLFNLQERGGKAPVMEGDLYQLLKKVNSRWCVDAETEALTQRGWVSGRDLQTADVILSMRPDGQLAWSPVRAIFRDEYSGPMYSLEGRQLSALVTPGHKFPLVDGALLEVERLHQGHILRVMGEAVQLPTEKTYSDEFVALVGWMVTEGSIARTRHRKGGRGEKPILLEYRANPTTVRIVQKAGQKCTRIRELLKSFGVSYGEHLDHGEQHVFSVTGELAQKLLAVAPSKVPSLSFLLALTPDQRELLIETFINGDGSRSGKARYFIQRNREVVDAFMVLCTLAGYAPVARLRTWRPEQNHLGRPVWVVCVRTQKTRVIRRKVGQQDYSGLVWCPQTDYGTFVCRRHDKVYVTGNTLNRLLEMTELSLCLWGECYWFLERGGSANAERLWGKGSRASRALLSPPTEIWWGRPDRVTVIPHEVDYVQEFQYIPKTGLEPLHYAPQEVIWFRYSNPLDQFRGLSALDACKMAADLSSAAMTSNAKIFRNGVQLAGLILPKEGSLVFTDDQVRQIEEDIARRFQGADKAHRWGVFRHEAEFKSVGITPRDAEFLGALNWSLEEVARAYAVPLDLIGGQRSYENVSAAMKAIWTNCLVPEARFLAAEITEQLLPMFPPEEGAELAEFDLGSVSVLQEDRQGVVAQMATLNAMGVPLNPLLRQFMPQLLPVGEAEGYKWGNVWWANQSLVPISDMPPEAGAAPPGGPAPSGPQAPPVPSPKPAPAVPAVPAVPVEAARPKPALPASSSPAAPAEASGLEAEMASFRSALSMALAGLENNSATTQGTHVEAAAQAISEPEEPKPMPPFQPVRPWARFSRRAAHWERQLAPLLEGLFKRQRLAVLARLRDSTVIKDALPTHLTGVAAEPFGRARWMKAFRVEVRPLLAEMVAEVGQETLDDLGVVQAFGAQEPAVLRLVEQCAQQFAREVNETTWDLLRRSLHSGMEQSETIAQLGDRVEGLLAERLSSVSGEAARSLVRTMYLAAVHEAYRQAGQEAQWYTLWGGADLLESAPTIAGMPRASNGAPAPQEPEFPEGFAELPEWIREALAEVAKEQLVWLTGLVNKKAKKAKNGKRLEVADASIAS